MYYTYIELLKTILYYINFFFLIYLIGYATFMFISVITGAITLSNRKQAQVLKKNYYPRKNIPVSIIVPAYNEEITVTDTIKSLLALDYDEYEIIIVDDGSKDRTSQILIEKFGMLPVHKVIDKQIPCREELSVYETFNEKVPVTLITKKNGGKADALNMGINASRYPYYLCMDADSILQHDSLQKIAIPFIEEQNVIAAGGVVRPANNVTIKDGRVVKYRFPSSPVAAMQVLEYDRSFLSSRILFDKFNGSLIISGAFGLFNKSLVIAAGGYESSTLGEDMELVVRLHHYCVSNEIPYSIRYATDAVCWTQVPEKLRDLAKQRKRWQLGLFQSMMKHKALMFNTKYGAVSFISYLYFLIYELFSPFIEIFGFFTMVLSFILGLVYAKYMVLFFATYIFFGCMITITAFASRSQTLDLKLRFSDFLKALFLCFFEIVCLRFVLSFVRATAFFGYKKNKLNWGKLERKKLS